MSASGLPRLSAWPTPRRPHSKLRAREALSEMIVSRKNAHLVTTYA